MLPSAKSNQSGIAQVVLVILVVIGIGIGALLLQQRTNYAPQAAPTSKTPEVGLTLEDPTPATPGRDDTFSIKLYVRSDIDPVNLVNARIDYDETKLDFVTAGVRKTSGTTQPGKFSCDEVTQKKELVINRNKMVSIICEVDNPGYKSTADNIQAENITMAELTFKALADSGSTTINIDPVSSMYRQTDGVNIIVKGQGATINFSSGQAACQNDNACGVGKKCQGGTCVADAGAIACSQDKECPNERICRSGECRPGTESCTRSDTCPQGRKCMIGVDQSGTRRGVCVNDTAATACTDNQSCFSGYVCRDEFCKDIECSGDNQCGLLRKCEMLNGSCVTDNTATACSSTTNCPANFSCKLGVCRPFKCQTDSQCGANKVCQNQVCYNKATGDGNGDGKVDLGDLSVLRRSFNMRDETSPSTFPAMIDFNYDGVINNFDHSQLKQILEEKGII